MNKFFWLAPLFLVAACNVEEPVGNRISYPSEVLATIEDNAKSDTKVYADENLKVLWNNDDRISLFNKYTYNKEYRFMGETGANAGVFQEVNSGSVVTGNELDYVYSVYPYNEATQISNSGVLALNLPTVQSYAENSFGLGANTMISATTGTDLLFKNLCGYLILKLYGDGVSVSSITLKGNNNEVLAGAADVNAIVGEAPTLAFRETGTSTTITLNCETPVALGSTAQNATAFWIAVPPTTFFNGFTITVSDSNGGTFEKATASCKELVRNATFRMGALEVEYDTPLTNNIIYYTSSDGEIVTPYKADAFGANIVSNTYENGQGVLAFDNNITSIEYSAFQDCTNLTSIVLPESLTDIGVSLFCGCTSLADVEIPNNVTSIGSGAFKGCTSLTSVIIPESVSDIFGTAFKGCTNLEFINIPEGVSIIWDSVFEGCTSLVSIDIPESVKKIMNFAFSGCTSLTSVVIPNGVSTIGPCAFAGCVNLTHITIPDSVTLLMNQVFENCINLTTIIIPESVTSLRNSLFSGCTNLSSIVIPVSVTSIGDHVFAGCSSLASIVIPESVKSIGDYVLSDCTSLTSITIPPSVTSIGKCAFQKCPNLIAAFCQRENPPTGGLSMFYKSNECMIYVPAGSVVAYKTADCWSTYADRIQAIPQE